MPWITGLEPQVRLAYGLTLFYKVKMMQNSSCRRSQNMQFLKDAPLVDFEPSKKHSWMTFCRGFVTVRATCLASTSMTNAARGSSTKVEAPARRVAMTDRNREIPAL
jgi:hypothetical protein